MDDGLRWQGVTARELGIPVVPEGSRLDLEVAMIVVGLVLLLIGFVAHIPILWTLGIIVLLIGLVLMVLGSTGRAVGGRRHYF